MYSLKSIISNTNYNYYKDLDLIDADHITNSNCKSFIESYFRKARKTFLTENALDSLSNSYRAVHSTITYYLGAFIFKGIKAQVNKKNLNINYNTFLFVWFLTALYHDYYFCLEDNTQSLLDHTSSKLQSLKIKGLEAPFTPETLALYLNYRNGKEHGISAGLALYEALETNLNDILIGGKKQDIVGGLVWKKSDLDLYALASSIIIKHNIWFANEDRDPSEIIEKYHNKNLDQLIIKDNSRQKYKDNEFLFIFYIVDTIDPIKIFSKKMSVNNDEFDFSDLLSSIFISHSNNTLKIRYAKKYSSIYEDTLKEALVMEKWMALNITCDSNKYMISIKYNI